MKAEDLQQVRPGFHDAALGSQAVFRTALSALSHPGRVIGMPDVSALPRHGHGAAAQLLQSLVDSDCAVWLSPKLASSDAAPWLRFHTGCRWAAAPADARFLWVAEGDTLPALASLDAGTDEYPDQSATCVIEVAALAGAGADAFVLTGPGIASEQTLCATGLPDDFVDQWDANHRRFPRGVDLFLATPGHIAGLPRSTCVRAAQTTVEA
ncbi:phosphonate C-P lyase system protein PhnH [Hydrogenophaga pseudoflava]|uniref:phosphonate C-P lyase system protein PhnH n=1 Tax=Hydrogenophaga pseudoflava TaxID=47421 RepID=UPI0027E49E92|nr:phosphonate C-P lyase system protein PhnH [Hydrogenophaga pseudoflava]MDQ7746292.1 phosphonate C-P lyase system protein PhnH [Hydrogenophaga pseudoflava]